jgi:hypothetical protein
VKKGDARFHPALLGGLAKRARENRAVAPFIVSGRADEGRGRPKN